MMFEGKCIRENFTSFNLYKWCWPVCQISRVGSFLKPIPISWKLGRENSVWTERLIEKWDNYFSLSDCGSFFITIKNSVYCYSFLRLFPITKIFLRIIFSFKDFLELWAWNFEQYILLNFFLSFFWWM